MTTVFMKLTTLIFFLFFSCGSFAQKIIDKNEPDLTPLNGYVIMPFDPANPVLRSMFPGKVRRASLDTPEVEQINLLLKKCIDNFNLTQEFEYKRMLEVDSSSRASEFFINLAFYQKQFVPVINASNQKEVWVNAFCYVKGVDKWHTELVREEDGGKCFFNVKINLTRNTFYNFSVNSM
jgi:hypothetical protein